MASELVRILDNPNVHGATTNNVFANAIDIFGDLVIIGAAQFNEISINNGQQSGRAYIFRISTGELIHTLKNPNIYSSVNTDVFGTAVAIGDQYCAVCAWNEDMASYSNVGMVYIFDNVTGELVRTIANPNNYGTPASDSFGSPLAIYGPTLLIGARDEDVVSYNSSGVVYVLNINDGSLSYTLSNPNDYGTPASDLFGSDVAITDDYICVGAYNEKTGKYSSSGRVYIFERYSGAFIRTIQNPNIYGTAAYDYFGWSIAIDGTTLVVGAYGEDASGASGTGVVYVFDVTTGTRTMTLYNPNAYGTAASDNFGYKVDISENYIIVGAYGESVASGVVYIFNRSTGSLIRTLVNPNSYGVADSDYFGWSLAANDSVCIVGARSEFASTGAYTGAAYIFDQQNGSLQHSVLNPEIGSSIGSENDFFSKKITAANGKCAISAMNESSNNGTVSGVVYVYDIVSGELLYTLKNPNAYGTESSDYFGNNLLMNDNYLIVSSAFEDLSTGNSAGIAYIFDVNTGTLLRAIQDPNSYGTPTNDYFGSALGMNNTLCAISAIGEDSASFSNLGVVYIYDIATGSQLAVIPNPNNDGLGADDQFGVSLYMTDTHLAVGCSAETTSDSGILYIFDLSTYGLLRTITNPNIYGTITNDYFGDSVSISGGLVFASAYGEDATNGSGSGVIYAFNIDTGELVYIISNPSSYGVDTNDYFGIKFKTNSMYVYVGVYYEDMDGYTSTGVVYIFDIATGELLDTIENPNIRSTPQSDYFGLEICPWNEYLLVGGEEVSSMLSVGSGVAYVFRITFTSGLREFRAFANIGGVIKELTAYVNVDGVIKPLLTYGNIT